MVIHLVYCAYFYVRTYGWTLFFLMFALHFQAWIYYNHSFLLGLRSRIYSESCKFLISTAKMTSRKAMYSIEFPFSPAVSVSALFSTYIFQDEILLIFLILTSLINEK